MPKTSPLIIEKTIIGTEKEKNNVLKILVDSNRDLLKNQNNREEALIDQAQGMVKVMDKVITTFNPNNHTRQEFELRSDSQKDKISQKNDTVTDSPFGANKNKKILEPLVKDSKDAFKQIGRNFKDEAKDAVLTGEGFDIGNVFNNSFRGLAKSAGDKIDNLLNSTISSGMDTLFDGMGGLFTDGLSSLFGGGSGGGGSGSGFLNNILGGAANFFSGGLLGGLFADGDAFHKGGIQPFAKGGIVNNPTLFPLGMMGEAGPEAIMPLKRLASGQLGVQSLGRANAAPTTTIINNNIDARGSDAGVEERIRAVLRQEEPRLINQAADAGAYEVAKRASLGGSYARTIGRR